MKIIKPKRLRIGQKIGLVAPASHLDSNERIQRYIEFLESLGFQVQEGNHLYDRFGYFAGTDEDRAEDLNMMFRDPSIKGIFCLTGGWGSSRILPFLDYELIQMNPKVLMGYSDITSLLNGIFNKTGLITFHGFVAKTNFSPYSLAEFKKIVLNGETNIPLGIPMGDEHDKGLNRISCLYPGKISGQLVGGNLTLMSHLVGTQYLPDFHNKILFLEDVNEKVYRIDRMLTQLKLSGNLQKLSGVVFGQFTGCSPDDGKVNQFTLEEVLEKFSQELGAPAISGLMIGHIDDQTTLPLGCQVELDSEHRTFKLLEAGVL